MILPPMYEVTGTLSFNNKEAVAYSGFCDIYKGSLSITDVCIKRLRISTMSNRTKVKQVSRLHNLQLDYHALKSFGGALQGGCDVEAPKSPEYCAIQGRHVRTPSTGVILDAWWGVERVHQE